jgi:serine protease Do
MFKIQWKSLGLALATATITLVLVVTANISKLSATIVSQTDSLSRITHTTILAQASDETDVNAIASATTVFIDHDLESKEALEQATKNGGRFDSAGSGVIVARQEVSQGTLIGEGFQTVFVHYVLTNAHVVEGRNQEEIDFYGVRTPDGDVHYVKKSQIEWLGNPAQESELDLAVLEFQSDRPYPVATITQSDITESESLFISGWPTPLQGQSDKTRFRRFTLAQLKSKSSPDSVGNFGYTLVYNTKGDGVRAGMSGGPVFNVRGELVGINSAVLERSPGDKLLGQGIQIIQFLNRKAEIIQATLNIAPPSVSKNLIAEAKHQQKRADILTQQDFDQDFNVLPTDPQYQAIQSLLQRYGCMKSFPNGKFRFNMTLTRAEFVVDLNTCIDKVNEYIASNVASQNRGKIKSLQNSLDNLEQEVRQFTAHALTE